MDERHPALEVARSSWRCVQAHDREGWLALMADDVCIEDPIGVGPTNPTGKGVCGKDAVAAFYDRHIAPAKIEIETHESHVAGKESAHVMTLTTTFPNGARARVRGIFTYRVNDAGRLASMRGYWTLDAMQFTPPPEAR
jgi:steroid delta-isomerase